MQYNSQDGVMNSGKLAQVRESFQNPPGSQRPLQITHAFERLVASSEKSKSEIVWVAPADPQRVQHSSLREALLSIQELGFGGVVANVSWSDYLQDEEKWKAFIEGVRLCRQLGLRVWIYDEEGYPSGSAGGLVLKGHPELEGEVLVYTTFDVAPEPVRIPPPLAWRRAISVIARCGDETVDLLDQIDDQGNLVFTASQPYTIERYDVQTAFEGTHLTTRQIHAVRRFMNVLDPAAVTRFRDLTYRAYADRLGPDFDYVEAFFTDEPLLLTAYFQPLPESWKSNLRVDDAPAEEFEKLPRLPWKDDLPNLFKERYGYDLVSHLKSLYCGDAPDDQRTRHDFHQLISELYSAAFFQLLQNFLDQYVMALSGHVLFEEPMVQHVATQGSLFAHLRAMKKPGIDMYTARPSRILDQQYLVTPKYASSAAHISGKHDVMSEVSDWVETNEGTPATLDERRAALAIQSALGVTTFTSYFDWSGFDRAEISKLMDFCARLSTVTASGVHTAPVAVIYPIRTAWVHYRPTTEILTNATQPLPLAGMDDSLHRITKDLLSRQIDFDFVDSQALREADISDGRLHVAQEHYQLLLIPPETVLSCDDMESIREFVKNGGRMVAMQLLSTTSLAGNPAESASAFINELAENYPEKVTINGPEWIGQVEASVERDLTLTGETEELFVRQSRLDDSLLFLIVNPSAHDAYVHASAAAAHTFQLWDPSDGSISAADGELTIPAYGARVLVAQIGETQC